MKTFKMNFLLFGFLILSPLVMVAQRKDSLNHSYQTISDTNEIFSVVEQNPEFPGGDNARVNFFIKNITYPKVALEKGIQGKIIVSFVVERDGSITNVKIIKGKDPDLDAEALRVVKMMPKWKPGKQRGIPVRCLYTLPVVFVLQ